MIEARGLGFSSRLDEKIGGVGSVLLTQLFSAALVLFIVFVLGSDRYMQSSFWGALAVVMPNAFWFAYVKTKHVIGQLIGIPPMNNRVNPTIFLGFIFFRPIVSLMVMWASYKSGLVEFAWVNLLTVLVILKSHWMVFVLCKTKKSKAHFQ